MHIAMISEHASPAAVLGGADAGGQNVYVDAIARQLARLGCRVDVFTRREAETIPAVIDWAPGVRIVNLEAGPPRPLPKDDLWPLMPAFRDALLLFTRRERSRYDVIHGHFWMSGWVATELQRRLDVPTVQIFHALGQTKRKHQGAADTSAPERISIETGIIRAADRLIAQCPCEWNELVDDYGADPAKIRLIPAAVDTRRFHPLDRDEARRRIGLDGDGPVIVYVGRMLPRKDVRNAVRALALLSGQGAALAQLLLVGGEASDPAQDPAPEVAVLRDLARELGVAGRVHFAGRRQPDELRDYYCAGDVVVTTPWYEPFGLTPLEAMACGRPVVGSAVGGLAYTIVDGLTGYLVPPRDPAALAARLDDLFARPDLRAALGQAARTRVTHGFTWPRTARRLMALYQEISDIRYQTSDMGRRVAVAHR